MDISKLEEHATGGIAQVAYGVPAQPHKTVSVALNYIIFIVGLFTLIFSKKLGKKKVIITMIILAILFILSVLICHIIDININTIN